VALQVALLAERLRVEERLLTEAFERQGWQVTRVAPSELALPLGEDVDLPPVVVLRERATPELVALSALLEASGRVVINRPATTRLLADRLALLRHFAIAGLPIPRTVVSFGPVATLRVIDELGFPVYLKPFFADPIMPVALVEDRDAAEALIEHRTVLGDEQAVLVQQAVGSPDQVRRLVIVGNALVAVAHRDAGQWAPVLEMNRWSALAEAVVHRLGSGAYTVDVVETPTGGVLVSAENLVEFRSLGEQAAAVAAAIVDHVVARAAEHAPAVAGEG